MAIDAGLLDRAEQGSLNRPVLRIYSWDRPSLSAGANQRLTPGLLARCDSLGIPVVRRPTGGSAVLHAGDLTYSVVARHGGAGVLEAYRRVAACLTEGFRLLGVETAIGRRVRPAAALHLESDASCFSATVGADLESSGRKICGSAQVRRREWFLQHGSIPIPDPGPLLEELLGQQDRSSFTCMDRLRPGTTFEELAGALIAGFERRWGPALCPSGDPFGDSGGRQAAGSDDCLLNPLVTL